jgi:hypothetical protein
MSQQMEYEEMRNQEHAGSYAGGYKDPFMSGQKISLPPPTVAQDQSTPAAFRLALAICSLALIGLVVLLSVIAIGATGFSHAEPIVIFTVLVILAMVCATTTLINFLFRRH